MRLKDGVEVEIGDPQVAQVGQLGLDALQVPAEVVVVQKAARLVGLPGGLGVLVGLVEAVGKGDVLVFDPLAEPVGEDLIEHPALDAVGGLEIGVVDGQLPARAVLPGEDPLAHLAPVDAAEVGVQVKVVKVQPHVPDGDIHREVVDAGGLTVEIHPVKDRHVPRALFLQDEVGVDIAQLLRDGQGQVQRLPGGQRAEGALIIGVAAVEQAIQMWSFLSKKPGADMAPGFVWLVALF